jgi:hypothetical protein
VPHQRIEGVEPSPATAESAAPPSLPAMLVSPRTPAGVATHTLARSLSAGAPLSNRAVAQMLMRDIGAYWATVADDPAYAAEAQASETSAEPVASEDPLAALKRTFRAEVLKTLERFAAAPAVEGTTAFDTFLTPATVKMERQTVGWTSCITTLSKIFNDAADVVNKALGVKVKRTDKGYLIKSMFGAVKFAANAEAEKHARSVNAWTTWPGTDDPNPERTDKAHPMPGDILVLHKSSGAFGHVGFFHSWSKGGEHEIWTTIDGGQGTKGEWKDGVYVEGSGRQEIKRRDRKLWPDGKIEGEPGQGPTLNVRGWVNIERLVLGASAAP